VAHLEAKEQEKKTAEARINAFLHFWINHSALVNQYLIASYFARSAETLLKAGPEGEAVPHNHHLQSLEELDRSELPPAAKPICHIFAHGFHFGILYAALSVHCMYSLFTRDFPQGSRGPRPHSVPPPCIAVLPPAA
jgi:hypothetical protein